MPRLGLTQMKPGRRAVVVMRMAKAVLAVACAAWVAGCAGSSNSSAPAGLSDNAGPNYSSESAPAGPATFTPTGAAAHSAPAAEVAAKITSATTPGSAAYKIGDTPERRKDIRRATDRVDPILLKAPKETDRQSAGGCGFHRRQTEVLAERRNEHSIDLRIVLRHCLEREVASRVKRQASGFRGSFGKASSCLVRCRAGLAQDQRGGLITGHIAMRPPGTRSVSLF